MMAAKPALSVSPSKIQASPSKVQVPMRGLAPWGMTLSIVTADVAALAVVLMVLVAVRHFFNPAYSWDSMVKFLPFLAMTFPAFFFQKLYPGVLIHPAEEMRRVFYSMTAVFLIRAGDIRERYFWRDGWPAHRRFCWPAF